MMIIIIMGYHARSSINHSLEWAAKKKIICLGPLAADNCDFEKLCQEVKIFKLAFVVSHTHIVDDNFDRKAK